MCALRRSAMIPPFYNRLPMQKSATELAHSKTCRMARLSLFFASIDRLSDQAYLFFRA